MCSRVYWHYPVISCGRQGVNSKDSKHVWGDSDHTKHLQNFLFWRFKSNLTRLICSFPQSSVSWYNQKQERLKTLPPLELEQPEPLQKCMGYWPMVARLCKVKGYFRKVWWEGFSAKQDPQPRISFFVWKALSQLGSSWLSLRLVAFEYLKILLNLILFSSFCHLLLSSRLLHNSYGS